MDYFVSEERSEIFFLQPTSFVCVRHEFCVGTVHFSDFCVMCSIYANAYQIKSQPYSKSRRFTCQESWQQHFYIFVVWGVYCFAMGDFWLDIKLKSAHHEH